MKCEDQQTESSHDHVTFLPRTTDVPYNYHHNPHKEEHTSKEATAVLVAALEEVTKSAECLVWRRHSSTSAQKHVAEFCIWTVAVLLGVVAGLGRPEVGRWVARP